MNNTIYLLSLTLSGIKNIDKEITLNFYKKTVNKDFDPSDYRTKAIYGENGSGKTAIVLGVQLLKDLLTKESLISNMAFQDYLKEIVNKKTETLHLECEFFCRFKSVANVYKYCIVIAKSESGKYVIANESMFVKNADYATSQYKSVFCVENGELISVFADNKYLELLRGYTANLLTERPFVIALGVSKYSDQIQDSELIRCLAYLNIFGFQLVTSFEESDRRSGLYVLEFIKFLENKDDDYGGLRFRVDAIKGDTRIVSIYDFEAYEKEVKKTEKFIKLFKHDLKGIEIEKRQNNDNYECTLLMNYGDYKVSIEFESTGIKKLVHFYDYLSMAVNGRIVFIDEMDSNINDVYLCKIIEFFKLYGKGQLCFTTHSVSPMEVLKECKNSIDFLSTDSRIVPWKKSGNFAPGSLYRRGMIEYLPFNIEAEDFLGIIGD